MIGRAAFGIVAIASLAGIASCMNDFSSFEGSEIADASADTRPDRTATPPSLPAPPSEAGVDAAPADAGADCRACVATKGSCRTTCEETRRTCDARCRGSFRCLRACDDDEDDCKRSCETTCKRCGAGACDVPCD